MSFAARIALRAVVRSNPPKALTRNYASVPGVVLNVQPSTEGLLKLSKSEQALAHHAARS